MAAHMTRRLWILAAVAIALWAGLGNAYAALGKAAEVAIVSAELTSVTFTSDHGIVNDNNSDWTDSGTPYGEPEWVTAPARNSPITHTRDAAVVVNVAVKVSPAGVNFDLVGESSDDYLSFQKSGNTSTGAEQVIPISSSGKLPNSIAVLSGSIAWKIRFTDATPQIDQNLQSTGPHTIYVTAGTPYGSVVTQKRISHVSALCSGMTTAHACAKAVHDSTGGYSLGSVTPNPLWLIAGGTPAECMDLARFYKAAVEMLGWPTGTIAYVYPTLGFGAKETNSPNDNEVRSADGATMYFQDFGGGLDNFEGTFRYSADGVTKYYAGGAGIYSTPLATMKAICDKTFWDLGGGASELAEDWP
jgi:hypothetical protein